VQHFNIVFQRWKREVRDIAD